MGKPGVYTWIIVLAVNTSSAEAEPRSFINSNRCGHFSEPWAPSLTDLSTGYYPGYAYLPGFYGGPTFGYWGLCPILIASPRVKPYRGSRPHHYNVR